MGDINKSASTSARTNTTETRTSKAMKLSTIAQAFNAGDKVSINLSGEKAISTTGLQFTVKFDASVLDFRGVDGNDISLSEDNLGLNRVSEGIITLSWNKDNAVNVLDLMNLNFTAKRAGNTAEVMTLTSDITKAEAYTSNNEVIDVTLTPQTGESGFELFQNNPNPFNGNTNISFVLPVNSNVDFKVYDVTGKILKQINKEYTAGKHTITLEKSQLGQSGILYYQLEAGEYIATKKMVVID
jgi:hypothetical protein